MPKQPPMSPLKIMNTMGAAAHQKVQPKPEPDEDDMPGKKSPKQVAAMNEKKPSAKAPKLPKPA